MTAELDRKRLEELAESDHLELESFYRRMGDLRAFIGRIHDDFVGQGTPPSFEGGEAIHILAEEIYAELERYLIPACAPDVAVAPVERREG